jgi:hypothetical protein
MLLVYIEISLQPDKSEVIYFSYHTVLAYVILVPCMAVWLFTLMKKKKNKNKTLSFSIRLAVEETNIYVTHSKLDQLAVSEDCL